MDLTPVSDRLRTRVRNLFFPLSVSNGTGYIFAEPVAQVTEPVARVTEPVAQVTEPFV